MLYKYVSSIFPWDLTPSVIQNAVKVIRVYKLQKKVARKLRFLFLMFMKFSP